MKRSIVLMAILTMLSVKAGATGQRPDYLIRDSDTLSLYNNPLTQYFERVGNNEMPDFHTYCGSTACWRGYVAYWKLEGDSLFLLRIKPCVDECDSNVDANLEKMFHSKEPFAYWYSGTLTLPKGKFFTSYYIGYSSIYEKEEKIQIENGVVIKRWEISNEKLITSIKQDRRLNAAIADLKDTFLYLLKQNINWEKLDNQFLDCQDVFILHYDSNGRLKSIELESLVDSTYTIWDKLYDWRLDNYCSRKIKSALKGLDLSFLQAHRDFKIIIELFYSEELKLWKCREYHKTISDEELKKYIKSQMNRND